MIRRGFWRRNYRKLTDDQIVQAFGASGREAYFDELFERYHTLIYGLCLNLTKHRENSKDLTLITFQKAHAELLRKAPNRFDHWLFTLCRNECMRFLRKAKQEERNVRAWSSMKGTQEEVTESEAFRRKLYEQELLEDRLLKNGIATLSSEQKRCLQLFIYERKTYREIAKITGYSLTQVQNYLQNGRLKLKRWIEQQGKK
jgi:RNA polymerase sigma-70 factor (ECF subfamily)